MDINLVAVLTAGLIDSFNPCAIGLMFLFVSLIFAMHRSRRIIFYFGAVYILAIYATYFLIGLGILKAVHLFGIHGFFGWVSAILLIVMGVVHLGPAYLNRFRLIAWINSCHLPVGYQKHLERGVILGALALGVLVGICEFPCSGGIYLATVGLLAIKISFWQGVGYLLLYNLMFILPLVVLFAIAGNRKVLQKIGAWQKKNVIDAKKVMGWVMIALGFGLLIYLLG